MPELKITNEDCMELMKRYPDKYFELAIVDPPYGIGAGSTSFVSGTRKNPSDFHRVQDWDKKIPPPRVFCRAKKNFSEPNNLGRKLYD